MEDALQSSVYVSSPEFAGWLMKKGFRWRKLWRKRWVALHGAEIIYMEMEPTVENSKDLTITKAFITSASVINQNDEDGDPNGFSININDGSQPTWHLRAETLREKKSWVIRLVHLHTIVKWLEDFDKVRVLGVGGTGIVYELLHKSNGQRYAMKEMEIKNKTQMKMAILEAEMLKDIMENVSHPNIMQIERVFQVGSKFYLVFPLCTGGELYEHIIKKGWFSEYDAAVITRDLIGGLHALHAHDILHLDIKPENIVFDTMEDDAKVMITDFGLSKVLKTDQKQQNAQFCAEKMAEKLAAFLDAGETYMDQLRGTIGYMSPELILTGHCCKGTDVFAAGVVLYILLSGRPPFNAKGNRDVLEQTCRGQYKMTGGVWESISDDAKDLINRMLCTNPLERITTAQILQHPWITQLEEVDEVGELGANISVAHLLSATDKDGAGDSFNASRKFKSKLSDANLVGTLRLLSGHVRQRRSEKLATNLSRIVSTMLHQPGGGARKSTLSSQFLIPVDEANSAATNPRKSRASVDNNQDTDADMLVLNIDFRAALVNALGNINELGEGKLTIDQFTAIFTQLIGISTVSLSSVLFGRFADRDGDGYISADDIFAVQAMLMQRSEVFLRQIAFRVYTESLWYPGRQFNLINAKQHIPRKSYADLSSAAAAAVAGSSGKEASGGSTPNKCATTDPVDVVEPPKHITARHVAAVFEKMGYDPAAGTKVFGVLLELLARDKLRLIEEEIEEQEEAAAAGAGAGAATSTSAGTSGYATDTPEEEDPSGDVGLTLSQSPPKEGLPQPPRRPRSSFTTSLAFTSSSSTNSGGASGSGGSSGSAQAAGKMDVADFIRAVEIDDILVQAITRRARRKMQRLMCTAEDRYIEMQKLPPSQQQYTSSMEIATEMLTEEFQLAFQQLKGGNMTSKPSNSKLFP